jgi:DNA gyrase inhibitor GyrI
MKTYHALFVGLGIIGVIILYVIWNIGLLKPVMITETNIPEMKLIFKKYQGPYQNVGPVFTEVENLLAQDQIVCNETFGRYYDNPNEIEAERTRADIGCIVESNDAIPTSKDLEVENVAPYEAIVGIFEGAPWLTAFKVYRAVRKESYQRNTMIDDSSPVMETYEKIKNGFRTRVYFRLKK